MHEHLTINGAPLPDVGSLDRTAAEAELSGHVTELEALAAQGRGDSLRFKALAERCDVLDHRLEDIDRMQPSRERLRAMVFGGAAATERGAFGHRGEHTATAGDDRHDVVLRAGESLGGWGVRTGRAPGWADDDGLSLARIVKGLATGDWAGSDRELRAMSETPSSAGGVMVPQPLSAQVIDRARQTAVVAGLGATTVPMTSATQKVPRLLTGVTPAWRTENSPIVDQNVTLDSITLTAKSMAAMVKISWELMDDCDAAEEVVRREFANMFAVTYDNAALYGSGSDPEPRGIANTSGRLTNVLATNGAQLTSWDWLIDAVATLKTANWAPSGLVMSPRTEAGLAKLRETAGSGVYLGPPPSLAAFPRAVSTQIPNNRTTGTANNTSDIFIAAWSTVYLGMRIPLRIRVLEERYADNGQIALVADLRGDVGVAQPGAILHISGVLP